MVYKYFGAYIFEIYANSVKFKKTYRNPYNVSATSYVVFP
jgi:hypothetical protein